MRKIRKKYIKIREKQPWRSVTFSKSRNASQNVLIKVSGYFKVK